MSRFGRFVRRAAHKVGDQVERSAQQVGSQVKRTAKQFGNFTQRQVRGVEGYAGRFGQQAVGFHNKAVQQVEHDFKKSVVYTAKYSPYITAVAAFIVNLVPVIGWILGAVVVAVGTFANRWGGYYAGRIKGMTTQEARNYGRTIARRNLESGLIGNALGGIVALFGVTFGAAAEAGQVSLMAGEGAAESVGSIGTDEAALLSGWGTNEALFASEIPGAVLQTELAGASYGAALGASSTGFFEKTLDWITANPKELLTSAYGVYTQVMKKITPAPSPQMNFAFPGGGESSGGKDPGGPGPGSGGGAVGWDEALEAVESFFSEYGEMLAVGLGIALLLALYLR